MNLKVPQNQFTDIFCARPQNFAWLLGAGTSRSAGLPSATDILWDLKRRHYCREENQTIPPQDIQIPAVRSKIQTFLDAHGFPEIWADDEYSTYFDKIFGDDRERQRKYLRAKLSEELIALSVGHRVLGALMASGLSRVAFTTNFDNVLELAFAEVSGRSLAAYHLEGSKSARHALDNEEYPFYCKLHGDFQYERVKNLSADLQQQDQELARCLVNAGNRFGLVVTGYSGRDASIMRLLREILDGPNPFPHGLYWTSMEQERTHPAVVELLEAARSRNVAASQIRIETFDTLMLRLWRGLDDRPADLDRKVRKSELRSVSIPIGAAGSGKPIVRLNALPVLSIPTHCLEIVLKTPIDWETLHQKKRESRGQLLLTKSDTIWCWGSRERIQTSFGSEVSSINERPIPVDLDSSENLHIKGFLEEALCRAFSKSLPLTTYVQRSSVHLIVNDAATDDAQMEPLKNVLGEICGVVPNLKLPPKRPGTGSERVRWAESVRISLEAKSTGLWAIIGPDIWIWPTQSRQDAISFLDQRRADRFNKKATEILDAWLQILLPTSPETPEVVLTAFDAGDSVENPRFTIGRRTAYTRRHLS